jgi:hypothetical protein
MVVVALPSEITVVELCGSIVRIPRKEEAGDCYSECAGFLEMEA